MNWKRKEKEAKAEKTRGNGKNRGLIQARTESGKIQRTLTRKTERLGRVKRNTEDKAGKSEFFMPRLVGDMIYMQRGLQSQGDEIRGGAMTCGMCREKGGKGGLHNGSKVKRSGG